MRLCKVGFFTTIWVWTADELTCIAKLEHKGKVSPDYFMMLRPLTVGISGDPAAHVFMGILTIEILVPDNAINYCVTVMKVSIKSREEGGRELKN